MGTPATYLPGVPTSDWIGLYPYTQTIGAQILAALVVVVLAIVSTRRLHRQERSRSNQDSGRSTSATARQAETEQAAEGAVPSEVTASMQTPKSEG